MDERLNKISVTGFKSIKELKDLELKNLNILIGANGAGKSNFIEIFKMLMSITKKGFSKFILERGGADNFLFNGPKVTSKIKMEFDFTPTPYSRLKDSNFYRFELTPTVDEKFLIYEQHSCLENKLRSYEGPSEESCLYDEPNKLSVKDLNKKGVEYNIYKSISNCMVYHFHDTGPSSLMRRSRIIEDHHKLREDAANIAPFLLSLKTKKVDERTLSVSKSKYEYYNNYKRIIEAIRLVIPFFDDFRLDVKKLGESEKVRLSWNQIGSDFPMQPYHLSDGSIRFICLITALLQPHPPSTIIIDEPELGLHPEAIMILAELIQAAAKRTQVIVATQSPLLIDQFNIEDIIVVNRENEASTFKRLKEKDFSVWLENYSVGELWTKNVIDGGSVYE